MSARGSDPTIEQGIETVVRELAVRRAETGLSLAQMAQLAGIITAAGISRIENGERVPTLRTVIALSRALGMTVKIERGEVTVS